MVSRVGKFVGGFNQDVTNTVNAHATENRVAFGHGDTNPTANVHVVGNILATTTVTATGGFLVPDDGDVGSASATDAMQISSAGIVTFKDDIKIKDGGTIGSATTPAAITVASDGIITFTDDIKIKDDGTIGSASAATAMTIDSSGIVTFVDDIKIKDGGTIGSASDADAISISSAGVVGISATTASTGSDDGALTVAGGLGVAGDLGVGDDARFDSDGAIISFGVNDEITLTHVHNTGLLLEDSGGSPTLQLHDANESVSSDGSKLILTSNGVSFNLPTADGSAGQVLKTDGSRTLSFTDVSTEVDPETTLGSDLDCGALSGATSDTKDAFGIAVDDALTELDLKTQGANKLGTVDMGALS